MKWLRWSLFGFAAALVFAIALAPARVILPAAPALADAQGPWWHGDAAVLHDGAAIGRIFWALDPLALLRAKIGAHWRFQNAGEQLAGHVAHGFQGFALEASGEVAATTLAGAFAAYGIDLPGTFAIDELRLRNDAGPLSANGALRWSGGRTTYTLGRRTRTVDLPAMAATLATQNGTALLEVRSFMQGSSASAVAGPPLLEVRLHADGWLRIRLTKRFLALAGNPWPGNAADNDFVIAVAEQCFDLPEDAAADDLAVLLKSDFTC